VVANLTRRGIAFGFRVEQFFANVPRKAMSIKSVSLRMTIFDFFPEPYAIEMINRLICIPSYRPVDLTLP
jgi:hypothetical protein